MKYIQDIIGKTIVIASVSLALSTMPRNVLAQTATVTINLNETHQTIDGFGVAQPGWDPNTPDDAATMLFSLRDKPEGSQIMDLAFSQANGGIGLTLLRMKVPPLLETSPGMFDDRDAAQAWIMQEAVKRGPVKLIAAVWSPPPWMKTNCPSSPCTVVGGELNEEHYRNFAGLLAHYASQYASRHSVDIYAVSMSNEPDTDGVNWDTCVWNDAQIARFLSLHLSPTFASQQIATKVIAPETAQWDSIDSYLRSTYNNPAAFERVDLVAGHLYGGDPSRSVPTALNAGKRIWQTEISGAAWSIDDALHWATAIHAGLTKAQISAWLWFMMFNGAPGVNQAGNLIGYDPTAPNRIAVSPTFWALGNFSLFIRPGFVRIGTTMSNASMLDASAYKDPTTGKLVVVVINQNAGARHVTFNAQGFPSGFATPYVTSSTQALERQPAVAFPSTLSVPARSIVTYDVPPYRAPQPQNISWLVPMLSILLE